ncbi:MAG: truB [Gammaproteobacteria bacterium]|jgi:tRNA pseudouridine55 synthase|nr:truB [Gammaproteobacteria bacterium]
MSRKRKGRPVNGILLLDKASGISSNKALQQVKHLYQAQKAGHTGSLDPLASGMLPICFGESTKFSHYLLEADKHYQVVAKLGARTDTADAEGEIIKTAPVKSYTASEFDEFLNSFRGQLQQVPSMFSALKHQGQPLYKLARQGIEIERKARTIHIYSIQLLDITDDRLELQVHCSKGTYIRNLIDDIGEALGCGAHVTVLRRLKVDQYPADQMISFAKLQEIYEQGDFQAIDKLLLPLDSAIQSLPIVVLSEALAFYIKRGQAIQLSDGSLKGLVRLTLHNEFIGIGEIDEYGKVLPRRLINNNF